MLRSNTKSLRNRVVSPEENVVSCARKIFNVSTSNIATEYTKMCGVSDIADAVAMCKDKSVKRYSLNSSVVCGSL